jgi:hypothetical protein
LLSLYTSPLLMLLSFASTQGSREFTQLLVVGKMVDEMPRRGSALRQLAFGEDRGDPRGLEVGNGAVGHNKRGGGSTDMFVLNAWF